MPPPSMLNGGCVFVFYTSNAIRESIVASSETHLTSRTDLEASDADALPLFSLSILEKKERARAHEKSGKSRGR